jgi:hypothetical protein
VAAGVEFERSADAKDAAADNENVMSAQGACPFEENPVEGRLIILTNGGSSESARECRFAAEKLEANGY